VSPLLLVVVLVVLVVLLLFLQAAVAPASLPPFHGFYCTVCMYTTRAAQSVSVVLVVMA